MHTSSIIVTITDDTALLRSLAERSFLPTYKPFISEEQVMYMFGRMYASESLERQIRELGHRFFISYKENEPAGFASLECNCGIAGSAKLQKLYVLPEFQGAAIGFSLMNAVEAFAAKQEQNEVFLNVNRYNKAVSFYERQGYRIYMEEDIDIGNGYFMNDYRMRKSLAAK